MNRLASSSSPYLRQHAGNPVDWWPWGDEAFAEAGRRDVPVFLSIGYATCHWCHVMAHESFEHAGTAALLNEAFVCVKVDREERPDVDAVHMAVCQAMTGHGGWPLTVLLTPDRRPFFAATYIPRESRSGRIGLTEWVPLVRKAWEEQRAGVDATAARVGEALEQLMSAAPAATAPGPAVLDLARERLMARFDPVHGGFGRAPKFPSPHTLLFLLQTAWRKGDREALDAVTRTLRAMSRGGIRDHLAGGFHRYSTDQRWLLPHFEKMLYDQALLAMAYTEGFLATGIDEFRQTAEETLTYVTRYLGSPEGAFHSAEDADSEAPDGHMEEGAFYVWTEAELLEVLGDDGLRVVRGVFGTEPDGNVADEATGRKSGANVLHQPADLDVVAARLETKTADLHRRVLELRAALLEARERRPRPLLDDKILADWNGLTIAALARAGRAFAEPRWTEAATRAADFVLDRMRNDDGSLRHAARGDAGAAGLLDDHAFVAWGLIELYQATGLVQRLRDALTLHRIADERFSGAGGGWFMSTASDDLTVRPRESHDGAVPSGQAVMAYNGLRLARMTGDWTLEERALRALTSDAGVSAYPDAHAFWMLALGFAEGPTQEVVVAGDVGEADFDRMTDVVDRAWSPNAVLLHRTPASGPTKLAELAPFTAAQAGVDGKAWAYVCERHACNAPTNDPTALARLVGPSAR